MPKTEKQIITLCPWCRSAIKHMEYTTGLGCQKCKTQFKVNGLGHYYDVKNTPLEDKHLKMNEEFIRTSMKGRILKSKEG